MTYPFNPFHVPSLRGVWPSSFCGLTSMNVPRNSAVAGIRLLKPAHLAPQKCQDCSGKLRKCQEATHSAIPLQHGCTVTTITVKGNSCPALDYNSPGVQGHAVKISVSSAQWVAIKEIYTRVEHRGQSMNERTSTVTLLQWSQHLLFWGCHGLLFLQSILQYNPKHLIMICKI